jgi:hypothetical protein
MSDLSDTHQSEGACPLPKRVEFAQWLLRFVDPDRNSDYRDAFWDLLRALLTQYQGDGKDGIEPSSLSTQELWRWALDARGVTDRHNRATDDRHIEATRTGL